MKRFKFDKILYIVLGAIFSIGGILLFPALTPWFDKILGIISGSLLLVYLIISALYIKDLNKTGKIISFIELFIYLALGVVSIISDVKQFTFFSACHLLAIALWVKGVCDVFKHIYSSDETKKFAVKDGILTIVFLSLGAAIFVKPITDIILEYVISSLIILVGIILILVAIYLIRKDDKNKVVVTKEQEPKEESEEVIIDVSPVEEVNIDPEVVDVTENENSQEEIVEELKEESNE